MDSRWLPWIDRVAAALVDRSGRIVGWTASAEALLSLPAGQVVGRPLRELLAEPRPRRRPVQNSAVSAAADPAAVLPAPLPATGPASPAFPPDPGLYALPALPVDPAARASRTFPVDPASPAAPAGGGPVGEPAAGLSGEAVLRTGRGEPLAVVYRTLPLAPSGGSPRHLVLAVAADRVIRWSQDHAFTRELFLQDSIGLAVFDEELRLARTNTHLLPYSGLPASLRGHRLGDFLMDDDAETVEALLRGVLRSGRPAVRREVLIRTLDDPRGGAVMAVDAFRLQSVDGTVIGVTALFNDVTEVHRSRGRLELLHRATAALGGSLSVRATAADLAAVLVPALGESASVHLAEAVLTGDEPVAGPDGLLPLRHTATAGEPDGPAAAAPSPGQAGPLRVSPDLAAATAADPPELTAPLRAGGGLLGRVTLRRRPEFGPYEPADLRLLQEIAARAALALDNARRYTREHRAAVGLQRSLLPAAESALDAATTASVYLPTDTATGIGGDWFDVIPLSSARVALVAGDVVGHGLQASATMGRLRTAVRTLADLDLEPDELLVHLDDLVSRLGVDEAEADDDADDDAYERAARIGRLGRLGGPGGLGGLDREDGADRTEGAGGADGTEGAGDDDGEDTADRAGGEDRLGGVRRGDRADASRPDGAPRTPAGLDPERTRARLDAEEEDEVPPRRESDPVGATCVYAVYDPVSGRCTVASAGHPPPAVVHPDGRAEYLDVNPGPPLGVGGLPFEATEVELAPGSVLALYTDGLIDGGSADLDQGMADLLTRLARTDLSGGLRAAGRRIVATLPAESLTDDVTLLLARLHEVPAGSTASWSVAPDPSAVAGVREAATARLHAWGLDELAFTTELVLSELVTNAIRYAGGPVEVRLIHTTTLTCEVSDPSSTQPRMRRARVTDEGGRGLYLVAQLTDRWGSRYTRTGKTIWAEQRIIQP